MLPAIFDKVTDKVTDKDVQTPGRIPLGFCAVPACLCEVEAHHACAMQKQ